MESFLRGGTHSRSVDGASDAVTSAHHVTDATLQQSAMRSTSTTSSGSLKMADLVKLAATFQRYHGNGGGLRTDGTSTSRRRKYAQLTDICNSDARSQTLKSLPATKPTTPASKSTSSTSTAAVRTGRRNRLKISTLQLTLPSIAEERIRPNSDNEELNCAVQRRQTIVDVARGAGPHQLTSSTSSSTRRDVARAPLLVAGTPVRLRPLGCVPRGCHSKLPSQTARCSSVECSVPIDDCFKPRLRKLQPRTTTSVIVSRDRVSDTATLTNNNSPFAATVASKDLYYKHHRQQLVDIGLSGRSTLQKPVRSSAQLPGIVVSPSLPSLIVCRPPVIASRHRAVHAVLRPLATKHWQT